jgi:DNA end-binding protein Ku
MAEQLIDSLSTDFDPSAYHDEYREQLLKLIERKAEGKEIVASEAETPKATKAPDLMAALEESIAAAQGKGGAKAKSKSAKSRTKSAPKSKKAPAKVTKAAPKAKSGGKTGGKKTAKSSASAKKGSRAKAKAK